MTPYPHGTANRYRNKGCRCDPCRKAWVVYHREWVRGHVAKGKCAQCGSLAKPGMTKCEKHLDRVRESRIKHEAIFRRVLRG